MKPIAVLLATFLYSINPLRISAQEKDANSGFMDFNAYYDNREFSVFTINYLANMRQGFQYFSFINYQGYTSNSDVQTFYSEHNLRKTINDYFQLNYQLVLRPGEKNDNHRIAPRLILSNTRSNKDKKIKIKYAVGPMVLDLVDGEKLKFMTQIEHAYFIGLPGNWYLNGFLDHNLVKDGKDGVVMEHQVGKELYSCFYAVIEYRLNTYMTEQQGIGFGLEYKMKF